MPKIIYYFIIPFLVLGGLNSPAFAEAPGVKAKRLVMCVFPRRNATETMQFFLPLANHLAKGLGHEVKLITAKNFKAFWPHVTEKRCDLVHYNQYHYIKSHHHQGYAVIVKNEEFGSSSLAGSITVRKDAGLERIEQLKGKKIVFGGGPGAMMSYIVPTYLLRQGGLQAGDYQEEYARNPPNSVLAAFYRQADAAGAGDIVLRLPVVKRRIRTEELTHLAVSEPLVHLPWAVKGDMPEATRRKIQQLMVELNDSPAGRQILQSAKLTGLHPADDAEYDSHRKIVKAVHGEHYD